MQDLNDLQYFARVVEFGGFAAASRALHMPRSKLSRRVAQLEERLNVRLIQRSTRSFLVTELGRQFYQHCAAMLAAVGKAEEVIEQSRAEPCGTIRIACPTPLLQRLIGDSISRYLVDFPHVNIEIDTSYGDHDLIKEGIDLAVRFWLPPFQEEDVVAKKLATSALILVASPELVAGRSIEAPGHLVDLPTIAGKAGGEATGWSLTSTAGEVFEHRHTPRLTCPDIQTLRAAAISGIGVAVLPQSLVHEDITAGTLVRVLPDWSLPNGTISVVFPTRRGLAPAVRQLIDRFEADLKGRCL